MRMLATSCLSGTDRGCVMVTCVLAIAGCLSASAESNTRVDRDEAAAALVEASLAQREHARQDQRRRDRDAKRAEQPTPLQVERAAELRRLVDDVLRQTDDRSRSDSLESPFQFSRSFTDSGMLPRVSMAMLQDDDGQEVAGALEDPAPAEEYNDGQDPTRPLWRVDLRYRVQQFTSDRDQHLGTLRIDMPVNIDESKGPAGGMIYTRIDIPFAYTNVVGLDNPNGDYEFEQTDALMQNIFLPEFAWVKENTPFDAIAIGVQWGFPVGSADFVSREKFAISPVFAWKWDIDGPNTFIAPVWRYRSSFGDIGNGENRDDVSELTLQPYINISTKDWGWPIDFITFYETQEIQLNFEDGATKRSGDWFIPFEIEIGKMVGKTVYSIDFATPIYKTPGFDAYDWFIEFRVGFLF